jgi:rhodanese-related sulfurtransferase
MNHDSGRDGETGAGLARGVLLIVAAGVALGVGFNALQRAAGSERALDWIGREIELASLESLHGAQAPPDSVAAAIDGAAADSARGAPEALARPAAPGPAPDAARGAPTPERSAAPGAAPPAASPPAATRAVDAGLPPIPDTPQPLEVQYATAKRFHEAGAAVFVDARSREEYDEGHIPGARHLAADAVIDDPSLAKRLDTGGLPIITYCSSADCNLSRDLAFALIEGGHRKVLVYTAGVAGWKSEGQPLDTRGVTP